MRKRLENENFTIISQNCIGGVLYHDLGEKFNSPTINLSFTFPNFVRFVGNLESNISKPLVFSHWSSDPNNKYPVCKIEDIYINFIHYKTFDDCVESWNKRKKRINYSNLFVMCTDREDCSEELLEQFSKLPYKKVCFVSSRESISNDWMVHVPGYEIQGEVGDLTRYGDLMGRRIFEKYFDCVTWLNNKK